MIRKFMLCYEVIFSPIIVAGSVLFLIILIYNKSEEIRKELSLVLISGLPISLSLTLYLLILPKKT